MAKGSIVQTRIENGLLYINCAGREWIIDPADYPDELRAYASLHGFKQCYTDAAAMSAGASSEEKADAIDAVIQHHRTTGQWSRRGMGTGEGGSDGLLLAAVVEVYGLDRAAAREFLRTVPRAAQNAMRDDPELKPTIDRLRLARTPKAAATTAADALAALRRMA